ncbi:CoA-disulfide reductase, partial [Arthrospira platensis SPKY1]|nr:CoA-disulfide reductase [Arthrospira platensis SPKY1]
MGQTGNSEKTLLRLKRDYQNIYLHPANHAGYYPGATQLSIKLLFSGETGEILGAQIVGREGVDKRIDVLATAIMAKLKVRDLA